MRTGYEPPFDNPRPSWHGHAGALALVALLSLLLIIGLIARVRFAHAETLADLAPRVVLGQCSMALEPATDETLFTCGPTLYRCNTSDEEALCAESTRGVSWSPTGEGICATDPWGRSTCIDYPARPK